MTIELNGDSGISTPSPVILSGSTSGTITLAAPAVAGTNTITLPARTGTVVTSADTATVTPTMMTQPLTLATAKAFNWNSSSSNTFIDFESIPSWVKRITVMFSGVSTSGVSDLTIRIGSGSVQATGYLSGCNVDANTVANSTNGFTAGFQISAQAAGGADIHHAQFVLSLLNSSTNTWICSGLDYLSNNTRILTITGSTSLSGTLDRVRITTVNGTDTFDAGTINIMYE